MAAVAGAGEIVAGTIVGGTVRVMAGIIGDMGIEVGFHLIDVKDVIAPAQGDTMPPPNVSIPNNGTTDTSSHGGGATVGGILGRTVPAAPYSGNQK